MATSPIESLARLRNKRADIVEKMAAFIEKDADGTQDQDPSVYDEMRNHLDNIDKCITRAEDLQAASMAAAKPVEASMDDDDAMDASKRFVATRFNIKSSDEIRVARKGHDSAFGRFIVGNYHVKHFGLSAAKDMIEKTWGDAPVAKALTLNTSQPIIPQDFSLALIPLLTAKSTVRKLPNIDVRQMPNGQLTIPRQDRGAVAQYMSEGAQIPVTALSYDNIQMSWHKYGAFAYTSKEMLEFSPLDAASDITKDLINKSALLEDASFLIGNGSNYPVKGILAQTNANSIFPNTTVSGAVNFQTVSADLRTAELFLKGNMVSGNFAWIMNPWVVGFLQQVSSTFGVYPFKDELDRGTLNGYPVLTTPQLATNIGTSNANLTNIILVNGEDCIIGDAYKWTLTSAETGSLNDSGTQVNLFAQDLVGFKLTNSHDFALKHDVSASVIQASGWTLGNTVATKAEYDQTANTSASTASSAVD